jgi:hypothetical protein
MRIYRRSILRSSHDLILIIGAAIAIAMIVSKMRHDWRKLPTTMGMETAVTLAEVHVPLR